MEVKTPLEAALDDLIDLLYVKIERQSLKSIAKEIGIGDHTLARIIDSDGRSAQARNLIKVAQWLRRNA